MSATINRVAQFNPNGQCPIKFERADPKSPKFSGTLNSTPSPTLPKSPPVPDGYVYSGGEKGKSKTLPFGEGRVGFSGIAKFLVLN